MKKKTKENQWKKEQQKERKRDGEREREREREGELEVSLRSSSFVVQILGVGNQVLCVTLMFGVIGCGIICRL